MLSVYRVRLEADKAEAPVLLANGNLEATGEAGQGGISRSGAIRSRSPAICSRSSRAISRASRGEFVTTSGRRVELGIYVEPGRESRARLMRWTR